MKVVAGTLGALALVLIFLLQVSSSFQVSSLKWEVFLDGQVEVRKEVIAQNFRNLKLKINLAGEISTIGTPVYGDGGIFLLPEI